MSRPSGRPPAFHRAILERSPDLITVVDRDGRVIYSTPAAAELLGQEPGDRLGRSIFELVHPDDVAGQREELASIMERPGAVGESEFRIRRADGSVVVVHARGRNLLDDPDVEGILIHLRDVTERRDLEAQFRQAQKMEAVGRLAGGIAHDFNNLLTAIGGYAEMAAERAKDEQVAGDLAEVVQATERGRALADKLLAFSRRSQTEPKPVNVDALIQGMSGMLRRVIGRHIRLETELAAGEWRAHGDPTQVEQAVMNLVINARDAMAEGGEIKLSADRVTLDEGRARQVRGDPAPGDYVRVTVRDAGTGIDADVIERVVEPFFTTKEVGKGSGLGLSIVFGAMTQAGGGIEIRSEPGRGTTVALYLPRSGAQEQRERERPATAPGASGGGGGRTVLLVEDEGPVRRLARRILEKADFEVVEAESGVVARRLVERDGRIPDLVVTDVIMPEMGGAELVESLGRTHPGIPVLYMSGYTADELSIRGLDQVGERFLPKPFTPSQLMDAVNRVLTR